MKAAILIAALSLSAAQLAQAAETVPIPRLRPMHPPAAAEEAVTAAAIPIPRLRPAREAEPKAAPEEAAPPAPEPEVTGEQEATGGWPSSTVAAAKAQCSSLLSGLDIDYQPLPPMGQQGGCGTPAPVAVSRIAGVSLSPPATLTCDMAAALHGWLTDSVKPAAVQRLGTEITEIHTATSYACRRRNNASSGKMSEHSKANALDMSGFSFAKRTAVSVGGSGSWGEGLLGSIGFSKEGSFLSEIRKTACDHFTTVLGPGSDPYHGNHFHVDVLARKGGYRICQ